LDDTSFDRFVKRTGLRWWSTSGPTVRPCTHGACVREGGGRPEDAGSVREGDTERAQGLSARFGIRSIPTLILFRNGAEVARISGARRRSLVSWVSQHAVLNHLVMIAL